MGGWVGGVVVLLITLSLSTWIEVELSCDNRLIDKINVNNMYTINTNMGVFQKEWPFPLPTIIWYGCVRKLTPIDTNNIISFQHTPEWLLNNNYSKVFMNNFYSCILVITIHIVVTFVVPTNCVIQTHCTLVWWEQIE